MAVYHIHRTCPLCGKVTDIVLDDKELKQLAKYTQGMKIQDAFPEWSAEKRETLKTGYCKDCQVLIFGH